MEGALDEGALTIGWEAGTGEPEALPGGGAFSAAGGGPRTVVLLAGAGVGLVGVEEGTRKGDFLGFGLK